MNWTWSTRNRDGGMTGLEFANALTAGELRTVLVHAAPEHAFVDVTSSDGRSIARGTVDRDGDYSPMTLLSIEGARGPRSELWPDECHLGLPVLLPGGEVGLLTAWEHPKDKSWWRWSIEFSNHIDQPPDWKSGQESG